MIETGMVAQVVRGERNEMKGIYFVINEDNLNE